MNFTDFVFQATGHGPYAYQQRIAEDGLPEALCVPTGAGKTLAAVLPWLWRRQYQGTEGTNRLVLVLPQRALVEQAVRVIGTWLTNLGLNVPVHVLMGGTDKDDRAWKTDPHRTQIMVGTQDMVLSRLLMRGYAESRAAWPMSFGVLHSATQFVFDETQLMGPGLGTSMQLEAFRRALGTATDSKSMWMSATLGKLSTVDFLLSGEVVGLGTADRDGELGRRLASTRRITELTVDSSNYARSLAQQVLSAHHPGTRTLVVLNTVDRAVELRQTLAKQRPDVILLHSRFRLPDRRRHTGSVMDAPDADQIVVSTQVLEAGVDISSRTLFTELAPWSSIVQRAGRCNRYAEHKQSELFWFMPPGKTAAAPYERSDLDSVAEHLRSLEGQEYTGEHLGDMDVRQAPQNHQLLRRHHLIELFDTTPDLSGNDIDVSPYIRDAENKTVFLAWRTFAGDEPPPRRDELCPAPIADARALAKRGVVRLYDQQRSRWTVASENDVRPTARLAVLASAGGYSDMLGFDPKSKQPVDPVPVDAEPDDGMDTDPGTTTPGHWYPLHAHSADTEEQLTTLIEAIPLDRHIAEALRLAARHHDIGKHHSTFQESLRKANPERQPPDDQVIYAKSPGSGRLPYDPPHFRHELVSALLLRTGTFLEGVVERDLAVYLALAHHGKIRLSVRPHAREGNGIARGVRDGDRVTVDGVEHVLDLQATRFGEGSLTDAALELRDRGDLGPFRLAYYESLVRAADWLASEKAAQDGDRR